MNNEDTSLGHLHLDPSLQEPESPSPSQHAQRKHTEAVRGASPPSALPRDILQDYDLAVQRAQTWTGPARFGFNAMLASPDYKNKLRVRRQKMERIILFLTDPDAKSREKDRADAQAKHQAQRWLYLNGVLYRKESRVQHLRRHVGADEVFDVLTAEHLRSGHHGRDKLLKLLEGKYIGYTKDEVMYVINHCLVCTKKHRRGVPARRKGQRKSCDDENCVVDLDLTSNSVLQPE